MKCVADCSCQVWVNGKITFFMAGQVADFDECPVHFTSLEEKKDIDFARDTEDMLLNSKWSFKQASDAAKELYNVTLKKGSKADLVSQILDARYRKVD
jgi:hypothetical protein